MKRVAMVVMVSVLALAFSGVAIGAEKKGEKKPDATLTLEEGQFAVGIGFSWGKGVLTFKGKQYPFKVRGLSVVDAGITVAKAEGKVYNLKKLEDFSGKYLAATAEATFGLGAGATAMKNKKGVVLHLFPITTGVNLKLAGEGMNLTLEKTK